MRENIMTTLPKYFRTNTGLKNIKIVGKEWVDKVNGNSYNAVCVDVNVGLKTAFSFSLPFFYGYGDSFIDRTVDHLVKIGAMSGDRKLRELIPNERLNTRKMENCRELDVIAWGKTKQV